MSRYIDADALMDSIIEKWGIDPKYLDDSLDAMKDVQTLEWINSAPSIDIVRCKECMWVRYCETEDLDMYLDCDKPDGGGIPRNDEWFCADGEREGE